MSLPDVAIIGAGVAGLTAAALLANAGAKVTVYEHHNVPGGCASFYQRDGFRFDVGATVVNGFGERGIHRRIFSHLGVSLDATRLDPAMIVHLPDRVVTRYGDERWQAERRAAFGDDAEPFWHAQERIADTIWRYSSRLPTLPADLRAIAHLLSTLSPDVLHLLTLQGRSLASLLPMHASPELRAFVDLQLLITAQTDARQCDGAFGATALDIAREGTFHLPNGIADISIALARSVRANGGAIRYRTEVTKIRHTRGRATALEFRDGSIRPVDTVIAAIPFENVLQLLGREIPYTLRTKQRWSAVTAYVGVGPDVIADDAVLHHQLLADASQPMGEANTAFVSISGAQDRTRARNGGRAITISTHTDPSLWEHVRANGSLASLQRDYSTRLLKHLHRVLGSNVVPELLELGTPFTFERYTLRHRGLVGGTPQARRSANLFAHSHRLDLRNVRLCGDTIFPGQSTVGVSLSAMNAVRSLGVHLKLGGSV